MADGGNNGSGPVASVARTPSEPAGQARQSGAGSAGGGASPRQALRRRLMAMDYEAARSELSPSNAAEKPGAADAGAAGKAGKAGPGGSQAAAASSVGRSGAQGAGGEAAGVGAGAAGAARSAVVAGASNRLSNRAAGAAAGGGSNAASRGVGGASGPAAGAATGMTPGSAAKPDPAAPPSEAASNAAAAAGRSTTASGTGPGGPEAAAQAGGGAVRTPGNGTQAVGPDGQPMPPTPQQIAQQKVDQAVARWSVAVAADAAIVAVVPGLAVQAREAMSTADLAGVDAVLSGMRAALTGFAALSQIRKAEMDALATQDADTSALRRLYLDGYMATLGTMLDAANVARPFVLWEVRGGRGTVPMEGYRGGVPIASLAGDPLADVAAAMDNAALLVQRFRPILQKVPEIRAWASALDPDAADSLAASAMLLAGGPLVRCSGREREALQAVAIDAADPKWEDRLRMGAERLAAQVQAEDIQTLDGGYDPTRKVDFGKLDAAADALAAQADSAWVDDDVAMRELDKASTPAEREYLLRRLRALDVYDTLYHGLDDGNQRTFDTEYRAGAGNFASAIGSAGEDTTLAHAAGQGGRMLPGAMYSELVGAGQAIPVLGDVIEKEWGDEARQTALALHSAMGVDRENAELSTSIGIGAGKVAASIGYGGVGGAGAAASKVGQVGGKIVSLADTGNSVLQAATGRKITGDEISGWEQAGAGLGALGGVVDTAGSLAGMAGKLKGSRVADMPDMTTMDLGGTVRLAPDDSVIPVDEMQRMAGSGGVPDLPRGDSAMGRAATASTAKGYLDTGTTTAGYGGQAYKAVGSQAGAESARHELAMKTNGEILDLANKWLKDSHGDPEWSDIQELVRQRDAQGLRDFFEQRLGAASSGSTFEQGLGGYASLLGLLGKGV